MVSSTKRSNSDDKTSGTQRPKTPPTPKPDKHRIAETQPVAAVPYEASSEDDAPASKVLSRVAVVIDDEPANRDFLERLIQQADYTTHGASSGKEAQAIIVGLTEPPALLIIDSQLPDVAGLDLVKQFRGKFPPPTKLVMATMLDDRKLIQNAFDAGCDVFLVKPHGFMELFKRLQQLERNPSLLDRLIIDNHGVREWRS
jgi:CheY-like chemotaxis protein